MVANKSGRYKAVAWTSGFTDYTISLLIDANGPLNALDAIGYPGYVATNAEIEASTIAWLGL